MTAGGTLLLMLAACNTISSPSQQESKPIAADPVLPTPPPQARTPCPVKITNTRMIHNLEMDVYTTVTNVSGADITAIGFSANYTDQFGTTREPYKTDLTSEDMIRKGHSQSMHWEILMDEPTQFERKPGTSEMYVDRVAFTDGRILKGTELEGCDFILQPRTVPK